MGDAFPPHVGGPSLLGRLSPLPPAFSRVVPSQQASNAPAAAEARRASAAGRAWSSVGLQPVGPEAPCAPPQGHSHAVVVTSAPLEAPPSLAVFPPVSHPRRLAAWVLLALFLMGMPGFVAREWELPICRGACVCGSLSDRLLSGVRDVLYSTTMRCSSSAAVAIKLFELTWRQAAVFAVLNMGLQVFVYLLIASVESLSPGRGNLLILLGLLPSLAYLSATARAGWRIVWPKIFVWLLWALLMGASAGISTVLGWRASAAMVPVYFQVMEFLLTRAVARCEYVANGAWAPFALHLVSFISPTVVGAKLGTFLLISEGQDAVLLVNALLLVLTKVLTRCAIGTRLWRRFMLGTPVCDPDFTLPPFRLVYLGTLPFVHVLAFLMCVAVAASGVSPTGRLGADTDALCVHEMVEALRLSQTYQRLVLYLLIEVGSECLVLLLCRQFFHGKVPGFSQGRIPASHWQLAACVPSAVLYLYNGQIVAARRMLNPEYQYH